GCTRTPRGNVRFLLHRGRRPYMALLSHGPMFALRPLLRVIRILSLHRPRAEFSFLLCRIAGAAGKPAQFAVRDTNGTRAALSVDIIVLFTPIDCYGGAPRGERVPLDARRASPGTAGRAPKRATTEIPRLSALRSPLMGVDGTETSKTRARKRVAGT